MSDEAVGFGLCEVLIFLITFFFFLLFENMEMRAKWLQIVQFVTYLEASEGFV